MATQATNGRVHVNGDTLKGADQTESRLTKIAKSIALFAIGIILVLAGAFFCPPLIAGGFLAIDGAILYTGCAVMQHRALSQ